MKLMTLHEPWATLMATGEKKVETRSWPTAYRGLVAIHSAKYGLLNAKLREVCSREPFSDRLLYQTGCVVPDFNRGFVIGVVRVVECIATSAFNRSTESDLFLSATEEAFGDYSPSRYGFITDMAFWLPNPIPYRSRQGGRRLLDAPHELVTQIHAQLPAIASAHL